MRPLRRCLQSWWKEECRQRRHGVVRRPRLQHGLLAGGVLGLLLVKPLPGKLLLAVAVLASCRVESQLRFRRRHLEQLREGRQSSRTLQRTSRQLDVLCEQLGVPAGADPCQPEPSPPPPDRRTAEEERQLRRRLNHLTMQLDGLLQAARSLALIDPLTRLPNRHHFLRQLQLESARAERSGQWLVAMAIDIDQFRSLTDTYGRAFGDQVLVHVARRLRAAVRLSDVLSRFDNESFTLLMDLSGLAERSPASLRQHSQEFAGRIVDAFSDGLLVDGTVLNLGVNVGVSLVDPAQSGQEAIVRSLTRAVGMASRQRHERVVVHECLSQQDELDDYKLFNALKDALRRRSLQMAYQPVVTANGHWHSLEALARWHHPERGAIRPDHFIAMAERYRLMDELGEQILRLAVEGFTQIRAQLNQPDLRLSVNMSPSQLNNPLLHEHLQQIVADARLPASQVTLEITEMAVLERNAATDNNLTQLRAAGFLLSLDDFGTGYSSLNLLNTLRPDEIKIDRMFIEALHRDPYARRIVSLIASMAAQLDLQLVAEGIEDADTFESLRALGIDYFQGYHLHRPLPVPELILAYHSKAPAT